MNNLKDVNAILGSKKKFRRALIIIVLFLSVLVYGVGSGELARILIGIFGK